MTRRPPLRSRLLPALAALALAVRLLVPAGFMPAGAGGLQLTICTSAGMVTLPGRAGHEPAAPAPDKHPCAFTALAAPPLGSDAPAMALPHPLPMIGVAPTLRLVAAPGTPDRLRPPLRAPPLST